MNGKRIVAAALFMLSLSWITGCSLLQQDPPHVSDRESAPKEEASLPDTGDSPAADLPAETDRILSASYFSGSFGINSYFHLYSSDGQVLFDAREFWTGDEYTIDAKPMDPNALEELQGFILDNGVIHWDGFSEQADDVEDGYSFSLSVEYESGKRLTASGYERKPDNYEQGHAALINYFSGLMGDR